MTNEQINTAIAAHLGITRKTGIPDFSGDLNEMHEAEKVLAYIQLCNYIALLIEFSPEAALASARQRAEAFLRTLGKWEETE